MTSRFEQPALPAAAGTCRAALVRPASLRRREFRVTLALAGALVVAVGCQPMRPTTTATGHSPLAKPKPSPDGSILEILTVELDTVRGDELQRMWEEVDDQALGIESRQALDRNGFRAGVASSQLPAAVHALINSTQSDPLTTLPYKQIQNRSGETFDFDMTPVRESREWQIAGEQGPLRVGNCPNAACALGIKTHPFGDRSVRLAITPKLRHGLPRHKYTVEQNQFLLRPLLDETPFAELEFACRLRVGQTLIIGPTEPATGLGQQYFHDPDRGRMRILLIRLVHSQPDDLFAPSKAKAPLVTPGI